MKEIYLGKSKVNVGNDEVDGLFVEIENEKFYKINNYNEMPDFFMTIVSDSDHWMFLSSNGALSAGRKNRDNALFPYYTDDKIHDYKGKTGSYSVCLIETDEKCFFWAPFTEESEKVYQIQRNIYKSIYGNKIIFEEINTDLQVCFKYGYYSSEQFGWIKKSKVTNLGDSQIKLEVLDGLRNILPYGVDYAFQNEYSNLLDAYKKNELLPESKLGLFMLSSIPVDRAEPSEALKTTTVWSQGPHKNTQILLSDKQIKNFKKGLPVTTELDVRASRGAYYINAELVLKPSDTQHWYMAAEVNQDSCDVANLHAYLQKEHDLEKLIVEDIERGTSNLKRIVANADGLQLGNEELSFARHFSNTLFNVMRGGIFTNNYAVKVEDFQLFVEQCNGDVKDQLADSIKQLPQEITYSQLLSWAKDTGNADLQRICLEYLPLTFSRRHGDPSRPWNQFSIETKNSDGSDKLSYQGNWRDIFQNWEALSVSFPSYIEGVITKFVNATTADGYNPYRITREGIDWECPDPNDPWAYIGYWGDHQIIYLQKFFEQSEHYHPGKLDELLSKEWFVYANVPYRIKSFEEIVKNPKDTIVFDAELNQQITDQANRLGADGKLLRDQNGDIQRANLLEKVLNTLLAKLSNFIPETGIWLNTQRPEWNDANNALVGNGVSMVTLYYLRRFLKFWEKKFQHTAVASFDISEELKLQFEKTLTIFAENTPLLEKGFSDEDRYHFTRLLGKAGAEYREKIYQHSFSGKKSSVSTETLSEFIKLALQYVNQSIQKNKRADGLYHAYNLVSFKGESISVRYLYEMLEGQVAVLSSGALSASESLQVLDALKSSALFRTDQYSYILYPDRELPRFEQKNQLPKHRVEESQLLIKLATDKQASILSQDETGNYHFNGAFRNAAVLDVALDNLEADTYGALVAQEKGSVLEIYEEMFDHQSFTGRSGTFYGYEGLGSIYWHMVSKLLLATQECYFKGVAEKANAETVGLLKAHYYEIKAGIGLYKSPKLYGAFPTDAYSHTPGNAGVKQPGLTGQVKEDFLSRFGELGVAVKNGEITFLPSLLNADEVLTEAQVFSYYDSAGEKKELMLNRDQLGFTLCQTPIIYTIGEAEKLRVVFADGSIKEFADRAIDNETSNKIFTRSGEVQRIELFFQL